MPYSQKKNPVKMMKSALHMYKAEKKQGMHRDSAMYMNSPMYAGHESPMNAGHESPMEAGHESPMENASKYGIQGVDELKYMPIVDDMHRKGDSPAKAAKPDFLDVDKDGDKTEPMKEAAKGSPATRQGYNARLDESLAKDGKESSMKQSLKDRRDESKGMEKSMGKGAYSSDPKMS